MINSMKLILILTINIALAWGIVGACAKEKPKKNEKETMTQKSTETIDLPEPSYEGDKSLEECIKERRSVRSYADEPLTLQEVSQLLWAAYGITKPMHGAPSFLRGGLKSAPSAGALYPLEIYLVAGEVKDLKAGIYKYDSKNHKLEKLEEGDYRRHLSNAALSQTMIEEAPIDLVYSAVFERTTGKYGDRGRQRYVPMDVGHSGENVYLQATALGLATVSVGAFSDSSVKKVIGMPAEEVPLYIMPVGRLK